MWMLLSIFAMLAVLVGACVVIGRRMREQIKTFVQSNGGSVRSLSPSLQHRAEFYVVFESRGGDLRRAIARVRAGSVSMIEDRPYHHCLRRPPRLPPGSATEIRLDDLRWQMELQSLPGFEDYAQLLRQLRADRHELQLAENEKRFAAILQCVEMQSMAEGDDVGGTLDLVVDGQPTKVGWRIEGECPNRVLVLNAAPA
jgi:hypothetical protein